MDERAMIRVVIDGKMLTREWFRRQWNETPLIIRANLYIHLEEKGDLWHLDFAMPLLSAAEKKTPEKERLTLSSYRMNVETDFMKNVTHEVEKAGGKVVEIITDLEDPPVVKRFRFLGMFR